MKKAAICYQSGEDVKVKDRIRYEGKTGRVTSILNEGEIIEDDFPRVYSFAGPAIFVMLDNFKILVLRTSSSLELLSRGTNGKELGITEI